MPMQDPAPGCLSWPDMKEDRRQRWHLESRRQAETKASKYWRVHGKLYDLDDFVERHPGGRRWLELTRGTDATTAVEAYHLDIDKVRAVLKAHYVRDVEEGEFEHGDRFTYDDNGFLSTLRRKLLARLKSKGDPNAKTEDVTGPTAAMKAACTAVLAQFTAAHVLTRKTGSYAAAALTGLMQVGMWGVGHNYMHQSEKKGGLWRYTMDVGGMHSQDWQISHGLSHHLDTNLDTDFEQEFFLMSFKDLQRTGLLAPVAPALSPLVNLAGSMEYVVSSAKEASAQAKDGRTWSQALPGLLPLLQVLSYKSGTGSWRRALGLYATQAAVFQLAFSPCAAGVHHSVPASGSGEEELVKGGSAPRPTVAWIEGQEGREQDWGAHQVAATSTHTAMASLSPVVAVAETDRHSGLPAVDARFPAGLLFLDVLWLLEQPRAPPHISWC